MSRRKRRRKEKSRKKLAYGVIAVALVLILLAYYLSFHRSNKTSPPKAAIVDHLSFFPDQRNPTFVDTCKNILEEGGLTWAYHMGEKITVDFYRNLPSHGSSLIVLRVHSAIMKTEEGTVSILGLFTSEPYSDEAAGGKYRDDVLNDRLVKAFFAGVDEEYFGILPKFVEESMIGELKDAVVIMMGCEGLGYINASTGARVTYADMAEAFVRKGAKVYISWDGPVGIDHTDQATVHLLQNLVLDNKTIKQALTETREIIGRDPAYNSTLQYFPETAEVGNYILPNFKSSLIVSVAVASLHIAKAPLRTKCEYRDSARVL